jgi:hypothetical protein
MRDASKGDGEMTAKIVILLFGATWIISAARTDALCDGDFNGDNSVTVNEIIVSVNNALNGCPPQPPTPTATETSTETSTVTLTATATPTDTSTPTLTATVTDTSTPTNTPTETPTVTLTPTATPLPLCGDGRSDPDEECDGADLNNLTCEEVSGDPFGRLSCLESCQLDTSGCAATRFVDNLDGTISDYETGLIWEKKCSVCNALHDVENRYPWLGSCSGNAADCRTDADCSGDETCDADDDQGTGLTIFEWAEALNVAMFAGGEDWRVPTITELQTLRDLMTFDPAIDPIFQQAACADVTNPVCSRTFPSNYWSSTTLAKDPASAWDLNFDDGSADSSNKTGTSHVRAVRSQP